MKYVIAILCAGIVVSFFTGRWTAPVQEDPRIKEREEQLKREIVAQDKIITELMNASRKSEAKAKFYKDRADSVQKAKTKNQTTYENAVHRIDRYTPTQLDSELFARFGELYQDSLVSIPEGRTKEVRPAGPGHR